MQFSTALSNAPAPTTAGLNAPPSAPGAAAAVAAAAAPVGLLLSLPPNTYLFGLIDNGRHLYIRPCYQQILTTIISLFAVGRTRGILVTGIPGVGKSFFAAFLMLHYKGCTIIYEDAKRNARWLICPGAPVEEGSLADFVDELKQATTIYLCDVGGQNSPEPLICNALTIVLASPDPSHFREWLKKGGVTLYMPMWSAEEVTAVVPTVYPERTLADRVTSIYPGRFKLHGGVARTIFHSGTDEYLKQKLMKRIKSCNLPRLLQSIEANERIDSLKLLQYVLEEKVDGSHDFASVTLDFASDEICERVMKEKEQRGANEVVSFLTGSAGKPDVAGMRGKVFELWAHRCLSAGGVFRARWENDASHSDISLKFTPCTQKGIIGDLTVLAKGVSMF